MIRKFIHEFLNTKFEDETVITKKFNLHDKTTEVFSTIDKGYIVELSRYHNGKDVRTRTNSWIKGDIRRFIDININSHEIDTYVLEWCRSKSLKTITE